MKAILTGRRGKVRGYWNVPGIDMSNVTASTLRTPVTFSTPVLPGRADNKAKIDTEGALHRFIYVSKGLRHKDAFRSRKCIDFFTEYGLPGSWQASAVAS